MAPRSNPYLVAGHGGAERVAMRSYGRVVATRGTASFTYNSSTDFGTGQSGPYSTATNVKFDDFGVQDGTARPSLTPGIVGLADASIVSGELLVQGGSRGGEAIMSTFNGDNDYMVQADVKLNSGSDADIWVRYTDSNNGYRIRLDGTNIALHNVQNGKYTSVASSAYTTAASVAVKIKLSGTSIKAWVDVAQDQHHRQHPRRRRGGLGRRSTQVRQPQNRLRHQQRRRYR